MTEVKTDPLDINNYEGKQEEIRNLVISQPIKTFRNIYPEKRVEVKIYTDEHVSRCGKTGFTDTGEITIIYTPDKNIVELKSLKLYLMQYRDLGIFQEFLTSKLLEDFIKACNPKKAEIIVKYRPRGGLTVTTNEKWKK